MDLGKRYFGKVYMHEAMFAMTVPEVVDVCIDCDTGFIVPRPIRELIPENFDFTQEDSPFAKEEVEEIVAQEKELFGNSRRVTLPLEEDLGVEYSMFQFAKAHKIKLPKYNTSEWNKKADMLFDMELSRRNLRDEWEMILLDTLHAGLAKWFDDNGIAYIDDCFDEYIKTLEDCTYVFSVSFGKGCYRHIKISSRDTLEDLALEIIDAFDFEPDHSFVFYMSNKIGDIGSEFASIEIANSPRVTKLAYLADFHFDEGDAFKFIFDFGDEWRFNVKFLRRVDEPCKTAGVIRRVGESPVQYPDWDDEDWDEQ